MLRTIKSIILQNLKKVLTEMGASMNDVVRTHVSFGTDITQWEAIGKTLANFFRDKTNDRECIKFLN